ncbi:hypothetical protein TNCV_248041 [Trichonephila clavipes]|nr:hypothetical protein TNCV_248041 [Trichonephila clavipes]
MIQKTKSFGKSWDTLATIGSIPRYLERAEAVVRFCQTSGHDFLEVYFHWFGVAANEVCPLSGNARMNGDHMNSMNTLSMTSSVGTVRLGIKWSRSQARA